MTNTQEIWAKALEIAILIQGPRKEKKLPADLNLALDRYAPLAEHIEGVIRETKPLKKSGKNIAFKIASPPKRRPS
jgi:hypothetical protein